MSTAPAGPETSGPRKTEKPRIPPLKEFEGKVTEAVQRGLPSEQGIADIEAKFVWALNDKNQAERFGILGKNYQAAHQALETTPDGKAVIDMPTKAAEIKIGLDGVYAQTGINGGKPDYSLPANTPPEKRQEAIRGKLKDLAGGLGKKLAENLTLNLRSERAALLRKEAEAAEQFLDLNISRTSARKLAFTLESQRDLFDQSVQKVAQKVGGSSFAMDAVGSYEEQRRRTDYVPGQKFSDLPEDDRNRRIEKSRTRVIDELKKKVTVDDKVAAAIKDNIVFQRIAAIDRKIYRKRDYLVGRKEVKEGDRVVTPEIKGAFRDDAEATCQIVNNIKELQLVRQYLKGEVRILIAQTKYEIAKENYKTIRVKAGKSIEANELPDVIKAGWKKATAWVNLQKEKVVSNFDVINADTENKLDKAKDFAARINPLRRLAYREVNSPVKAENKRGKVKKEESKSLAKRIMESPVVVELKRKREGTKAAKRVERLRTRKDRADSRYESWIDFKDGIRRKKFEIKLSLRELRAARIYTQIVAEKGKPKLEDFKKSDSYVKANENLESLTKKRDEVKNKAPETESPESTKLDKAKRKLQRLSERVVAEVKVTQGQVGTVTALASEVAKSYLSENFNEDEQKKLAAPHEQVVRTRERLKKIQESGENLAYRKKLMDKRMAFNPWYKKVDKHLEEEIFGKAGKKSEKDKGKKKTDGATAKTNTPDKVEATAALAENKVLTREEFQKEHPDKKGERLIVVSYKDDAGKEETALYYVWTDGKKMKLELLNQKGKRVAAYEGATRDIKVSSNFKDEFKAYLNGTLRPFREQWKKNKFITVDENKMVDLSSGEFRIGELPPTPVPDKTKTTAPPPAKEAVKATTTPTSPKTEPEPAELQKPLEILEAEMLNKKALKESAKFRLDHKTVEESGRMLERDLEMATADYDKARDAYDAARTAATSKKTASSGSPTTSPTPTTTSSAAPVVEIGEKITLANGAEVTREFFENLAKERRKDYQTKIVASFAENKNGYDGTYNNYSNKGGNINFIDSEIDKQFSQDENAPNYPVVKFKEITLKDEEAGENMIAVSYGFWGGKVDKNRNGPLRGVMIMKSTDAESLMMDIHRDPRALFDVIYAANGGRPVARYDGVVPYRAKKGEHVRILAGMQGDEVQSGQAFEEGYEPFAELENTPHLNIGTEKAEAKPESELLKKLVFESPEELQKKVNLTEEEARVLTGVNLRDEREIELFLEEARLNKDQVFNKIRAYRYKEHLFITLSQKELDELFPKLDEQAKGWINADFANGDRVESILMKKIKGDPAILKEYKEKAIAIRMRENQKIADAYKKATGRELKSYFKSL